MILTGSTLLVTQNARAQTPHSLTLTEISSTSLTALLDGTSLDVVNVGSDLWVVPLQGVSSNQIVFWTEPENMGEFNAVATDDTRGGRVKILSDYDVPGISGNANGFTDTANFSLNGEPLYVTFSDNAATAEVPHSVPDTGTTFALFLSVLGLLLGATRFRGARTS